MTEDEYILAGNIKLLGVVIDAIRAMLPAYFQTAGASEIVGDAGKMLYQLWETELDALELEESPAEGAAETPKGE